MPRVVVTFLVAFFPLVLSIAGLWLLEVTGGTLNGSGSTDVDGDALTYSWTLTGKPVGSNATLSGPTTASPAFVADKFGIYTAQLIVNDGTVDGTGITEKNLKIVARIPYSREYSSVHSSACSFVSP